MEFTVADTQFHTLSEKDNEQNVEQERLGEMYADYLERYGHGLGSYGIEEISTHLLHVKEEWLIWPFSEKRKIIVKMIIGTSK